MPFKPVVHPKCNRCNKTAYPAESTKITIGGENLVYLNSCFKCIECGLKLTLSTYKVSDFGDLEIFCKKCVPKQAPSQAAETVEADRTRKAAAMTKDVGIVNQQLRGADETKGVGASGSTTAELERAMKASNLTKDVGIVNEQVVFRLIALS